MFFVAELIVPEDFEGIDDAFCRELSNTPFVDDLPPPEPEPELEPEPAPETVRVRLRKRLMTLEPDISDDETDSGAVTGDEGAKDAASPIDKVEELARRTHKTERMLREAIGRLYPTDDVDGVRRRARAVSIGSSMDSTEEEIVDYAQRHRSTQEEKVARMATALTDINDKLNSRCVRL